MSLKDTVYNSSFSCHALNNLIVVKEIWCYKIENQHLLSFDQV